MGGCVSKCFKQDLLPGRHFRVGTITYDLEAIDEHDLLNQLSEWDFPVFDLYNEMGDRILSQVRDSRSVLLCGFSM